MQRVTSGPYRILIVDDSPSIHEDFRRIFESLRAPSSLEAAEKDLFGTTLTGRPGILFEVTSAYQGAEALKRVKEAWESKRPFGAAFVDMRMPPGWNGVQTIRELWEVDPDLQVVLCTAYSDYRWDELLDQLGVTDRLLLLKKPFDRIEALLMGLALSQKRQWIAAARAHMARLEERVRERTAALQYQAETDRLTGLANREVFLQLLQRRIDSIRRRATPSIDAVLFIDLDDFKIVNDTLGHAAGDELLRQVARRLQTNTRHDARVRHPICGRLGGDEFAVLLEDLPSVEPARNVAQRLLYAIQQPYDVVGRSVRVRASAGVAVVDRHCPDAAELVRRADVAMYEAKREGKGKVLLFDEAMSQRLWRRVEVEQRLRVAVQEQHFRLAYQPVVDLNNLHLTYYEALLRWPAGEDESPMPEEFLNIARQCGLIESIGNWVIVEACRQLACFRQHRPPGMAPRLSINVAGHQLVNPEFASHLAETMRHHGVTGPELILEVTEAELANGVTTIAENLEICRSLGIEVQMDDFGTGASSLNQLRTLPFTGIKLDRTCLATCHATNDYSLIEGILALARSLELTVVAEGIETKAQWQILRDLGCPLGQGYWIGRPEFLVDPRCRRFPLDEPESSSPESPPGVASSSDWTDVSSPQPHQ